jgi:cellulose synthase/poly-beta-1,6-N-acetylglucosamine synthase-like glycosyltransferase
MASEPSKTSVEKSSTGKVDAPLISVIIPHYNDLVNLERCMGLLAAQTLPRSQFEVVVADNNSRCGLQEVERVCSEMARVVPAAIQGAGAARNAGVQASRGCFLAFIDSDCRAAPTWLERGLAALATAQIVGGRVDVDVEDPAHPTPVELFEKVFAFNFKRYIEKLGFSGTGNMFVPREAFDRVGSFRGRVAEDLDWGRRAIAAGYRWRYAEDVIVAHPARRTWKELTEKWGKWSREAFAACLERPHGRIIWFGRSFLVLASPFAHWAIVLRSTKLQGARQRLSAIAILFRIRFWRFLECQRLLLKEPAAT